MTKVRVRRPVGVLAAIAGAVVVALNPLVTSSLAGVGSRVTAAAVALLGDTALIMGGTATPDPPQALIDKIAEIYVDPHFPGYVPVGVHTPAEFWPIVGTLTGDQSVAQGVADLHTAITETYAGDNLLVFGVSQSALIAGNEMQNLVADPPEDLADLHFALLGDPANPAGGILERFADLQYIPILDMTLGSPTPVDAFPTAVYTGEYDAISDFPRYPLNYLAVINAIIGLQTVHLAYANLTADDIDSAVHIGTSGLTDFYMMPTEQLPILWPLYQLGDVGKVVADAIEPQLRVLIDLGYGNLQHGEVADVADLGAVAQIGFWPRVDLLEVLAALQLGQVQGIVNASNDVLGFAGLPPLPDFVTDVLKVTSGYDITNGLDQALTSMMTHLSEVPGLADLHPDVVFDGSPIIDGAPLLHWLHEFLDCLAGL